MKNILLKISLGLLAVPVLAQEAVRPPLPSVQVTPGISGQAAITALGTNLAAVAAHYGRNASELTTALQTQPSLRLDGSGNLFFACTGLAIPPGTSFVNNPGSAIFPLAQTFLLHSKPGSTKTIFLDFDGQTISGTAWNTVYNNGNDIVAPPWDIDGNPFVFGTAEQIAIQQVWLRVAEDYAPFDVDVTTEYPGEAALTRANPGDQVYGTRALISPISSYFGDYGGLAYVGVFNEVGDTHKPALIFPENLLNGEKFIAEAVSHEVGHNLNLEHQGTTTEEYYLGQGNWCPIMGAGYYVPITHWAHGEYQNASQTEDELSLITSTGLNFRQADFGNSIATATALLGISPRTNGIIARTNETDFVSFQTGSGQVLITVTNWERGQNAHLRLGLYNSGGTLLTNIDSADMFSGIQNISLQLSLSDGKYYVSVGGTGNGNPFTTGYSYYGSLGNYSLSITNPPGTGTTFAAPPPPYGSTLSALNGGNPNGNWLLFVADDAASDVGIISNGWFLTLITASPVGLAADAGISVTTGAGNIGVGSNVVFVVGVTNYGPSPSTNVVVTDNLPLNATYLSNSVTQGSVIQNGSVLTWTVGNLATNAGARMTVTLQTLFSGSILNSASVATTSTDPNPDDDVASAAANAIFIVTQPVQLLGAYLGGSSGFQISGTNTTSSALVIQASTNLTTWVPIFTNTPPPFDFNFVDSNATNFPQRFYRSVITQ